MAELNWLSIQDAHAQLTSRQISSVELTQACLDRIDTVEDRVQSFLTLTPEIALSQAAEADRMLAAGEGGPLTGVPVQIKDVMCTEGVLTTCASRMLENFVPVYNATAVERLMGQGAVMLGKGNMDEFAMGSSCENSAFHPTRNPWDLDRVPGGSSGGAAASVAAGEAIYALGSDTGGSVRQPASLCGVVGLKPTYGLVSRYGLIAFASSFDQIGPVGRSVMDCALTLNAIAGHDPRDATSAHREPTDYAATLGQDIKGLRLGVPEEYFVDGMDPGTRKAVEDAVSTLEGLGASVRHVSLPTTRYALACYYIIAPSECSANLARYDGVKYGYSYQDTTDLWEAMEKTREYGFGPEVTRRVMLGTYALSSGYYDAYYLKAQKARTLIRQDFDRVFQDVDVLVTPTSPVTAFKIGEKIGDPVQMYLIDVCTLPVNIAGLPGLSVPCGFSDGLPVGMQLIGPHFSEETLLRTAHAYETATEWSSARPEI
ncbi:MAG TPA: Asp-tRNA(Asn)/Glu-tRNA(Gln) amidotransferase subunit GatA [Dehalococcoidia bacterium]|nr:Asp-tRNA(Asn)/Glu-tRNA(Gln) amidotransferase subunit GatA [Dehalococcoidia bacterium]PKB75917.1 MAG: aspartyl/glutamyl-tRNA amidotransferase subunit A [SAR202 cluster bacterium MP-SAtl-SRR3965592-G1]PKB80374.1 MAG: aspartyl/glutamyl-tRNA amidotransferase subunit A [SAR202 cluster bacterium MP-SInd-SRR3963457-G1]PKB83633.1 MAG: aspartyl/glutamyl-tRNA amidotransferase subunit A [SAR202 cluster bacterium MP-NPac-SRR3961935-G1]RUA31130.1 MAG: Asp-tRNA(Asn)/Glu-tRNA(Gln) amidotransferase GatCAB s